MAKFTTTITFANGDQVTSTKLNQIISGLSLSTDSVDGSTITLNSGVLSLGVATEANIGANSVHENAYKDESIPPEAFKDDSLPARAIEDDSIPADKLTATVPWTKLLTADVAGQTDMQSETAAHFVAPDVLKYFPGVSKAGAVLTMADGTYAGAYNISGTATGTSTSRTVTIPEMANANYRVQFSPEDSGTIANAPVVTAKTTTTFTVASGSTKIAFDIFGQLA